MKKFLLSLTAAFFFCLNLIQAQVNTSYKFEKIMPADFLIKPPVTDSNANAIVIADVGSTAFEGNNRGNFTLIFKIHERILLKSRNAFDEATVKFSLFTFDVAHSETVHDMEATTYTLLNGQVSETHLAKSAIFTEKANKYYTNYKFTLPDLTEGCIIDYTYTIKSPYISNEIKSWIFQGEYPCLWSEYTVEIPPFFNYIVSKQGYLPFAIDSSKKIFRDYRIIDNDNNNDPMASTSVYSLSGDAVWARWAMKDIPAFKSESYITTSSNYIPKIKFQLYSIKYSDTYTKIILKDWINRANDLLEDEDFGKPLTENNSWLKPELESIAKGTNLFEIVKNIWQYVRDNFICTDDDGFYLSQPLKKTFQTKKGNVADINLLLTAMLLQKGYNASPVLLSTREHGYPIETESVLNQFNYVITRVLIDSGYYLLDATQNRLGFGKLPEKCYNKSGRLIAKMPYLVNLSADSLIESKNTFVSIINDDKGDIAGTLTSHLGYYESYDIRNKLVGTKQEEFTKDIAKSYPNEFEITNIALDSVNNYNIPITVNTDFKIKFDDDDIIYFNPMLNEAWKKNPFDAAERLYPVEMPYVMNEVYNFNMQIPVGYEVDELPKSARVKLNEDEGMFEYLIEKSNGFVQMRCSLKLTKANYLPEDYKTLRDFFAYVVKKQAEPIVFKKKK